MKHRLIFPAIITAIEERPLGWFFIVKLGSQEFAFFNGPKPESPCESANLILEYEPWSPDADPSPTPVE